MENLYTKIEHPVITHKLSLLRDENTDSFQFRGLMNEIGRFMAYEATRDLAQEDMSVTTPMAKTTCKKIVTYPTIVSILRAGNGMLDGALDALPYSSAGHIGIYRDKFIKNTVEYYFKLPDSAKGNNLLLIDPLLATGDTAIACIDRLKKYNVGKIKMISILVSQVGLEKVKHFHPDVEIFALSKEEGLNDEGYLMPGLGDAGDRLYHTK